MSKFALSGRAVIAQIVATVAVVFSLLLVAHSIGRHTDEMESSNSNFLYQLDVQIGRDLSLDLRLATIFLKMEQNEALSDIEKFQYVALWERYVGVWEIAWTQYTNESLTIIDWRDWDAYLSDSVTGSLPEEWWIEVRSNYKPKFVEHVNGKYAEKKSP